MAYDLHGTWNQDNLIGNYVWAHTNLTEIDLAFDLFWRNDVPSYKINLGLAVCHNPQIERIQANEPVLWTQI